MSITVKTQRILCTIGLWLLLCVCSVTAVNAQSATTKAAIIYEYETITQKKGEPFASFLAGTGLSAQYQQLVRAIPILHAAKSDRQFRFSYALDNTKRQLKEVKVTRGNRVINFVLQNKDGKQQFVKQATQIPAAQLKPKVALQSTAANAPSKAQKEQKTHGNKTPLEGFRFVQRKGQDLKTAWQVAKLSSLQQRIVDSGDFIKSAKSDREFTLYFERQGNRRLLKGLRVKRNQTHVDYHVDKVKGQFKLIGLRTLKATQRKAISEQFAKAKLLPVAQSLPPVKLTATPTPINLTSTVNTDFGLQFTQKKGQTLEAAWQVAKLSKLQQRIVLSGDFVKAARSDRQFILFFEKDGSKRLLKGLRVKRNQTHVDYAVKKVNGQFTLVNLKTLKSTQRQRLSKLFSSVKVSALKPAQPITLASTTKDKVHYIGKQFNQYKGQSLEKACAVAKLSTLQQQIVNSGDFVKLARSTRQFTLYYEKNGSKALLKGLRVTRNKNSADYGVKKVSGKFQLVNLKTLPDREAAVFKQRFKAAKVQRLRAPTTMSAANKSTSSSSMVMQRTQGNYAVVSVTQKKGQTLYSAIKDSGLTSTQRQLVINMPASQSAQSTRRIHLLFEKEGRKKYLRALRVVRGNKAAEYVLVKSGGRRVWVDDKGQIDGGGSFTRYPLKFSRVSSGFNLHRRHPVTRRVRPHKGIDLKAPHGAPIYAPAGGVVTYSGRQRGYGIILEIDHQNGYRTKYAHLSRIMRSARKGMRVKKGQLIAKVGNTGISTGAHLHYEILVNGVARNPRTVRLPGGGGKKTVKGAKSAVAKYLPTLRRLSR